MSLIENYNESYKNTRTFIANEGLVNFISSRLETYKISEKSIIEAGCGSGSLLNKIFGPNNNLIAFDFSKEAIRQAQQKYPNINFFCEDIIHLKRYDKNIDIIIDSHLIHCLMGQEMVEDYLMNCYNSLIQGGKMFVECMIFSKAFIKKFGSREDGIYNEENIIRTIINYLDYEKIFIKIGFKIDYFYILGGRKFVFSSIRENVMPFDPDVLQVCLIKSN